MTRIFSSATVMIISILGLLMVPQTAPAEGVDLPEIKKNRVIRHIGVPYANFNTGMGNGLSIELIQRFAAFIGVEYEYVEKSWKTMFNGLTGKTIQYDGTNVHITGDGPIQGDVIATGCTILPWRKKVVSFSVPTFPTQVWLIARSDSPLRPIEPSGDIDKDIAGVKNLLKGYQILTKKEGCLNPKFYNLEKFGATPVEFEHHPNQLVPAVLNGEADATILDVPHALVALQKWPGQIKIIGPVSRKQNMAVAFRKDSPQLLKAFNSFLQTLKNSGNYSKIVQKYYPNVFLYNPDYFL